MNAVATTPEAATPPAWPAGVAVFVNLENLLRAAPVQPAAPALAAVFATAARLGPVAVRRAYGNLHNGHVLDSADRAGLNRTIQDHLLPVEPIPAEEEQGAWLPLRLAVDALTAAFTLPDVQWFVFAGLDAGAEPLFGKLHEMGRRVALVGCGTPAAAAPRGVAGPVLRQLAPPPAAVAKFQGRAVPALPAAAGPVASAPLSAAVLRFCAALEEVLRKERRPVGAAIAYELTRLDPALAAGCDTATVRRLAAQAEEAGCVKLTPYRGDVLVTPVQLPAAAAAAPAVADATLALLRGLIEARLKCPLPSRLFRQRLYEAAHDVWPELPQASQPVTLIQLSYAVTERLGAATDQRLVFKILFTLLLADVFVTEARYSRPHDIRVRGLVQPVACWDERFAWACITGIASRRTLSAADASAFGTLFELPTVTLSRLLATLPQSPLAREVA